MPSYCRGIDVWIAPAPEEGEGPQATAHETESLIFPIYIVTLVSLDLNI